MLSTRLLEANGGMIKIMGERNGYIGNQFVDNIKSIEYRGHAIAQDITIRNYKEYYGAYTIIMRSTIPS